MKLGICDDEAVVHHQVKEYIEGIDFGGFIGVGRFL